MLYGIPWESSPTMRGTTATCLPNGAERKLIAEKERPNLPMQSVFPFKRDTRVGEKPASATERSDVSLFRGTAVHSYTSFLRRSPAGVIALARALLAASPNGFRQRSCAHD